MKEKLKCKKCGATLGSRIIYQKENRPAYRLFVGAIEKKIITAADLALYAKDWQERKSGKG